MKAVECSPIAPTWKVQVIDSYIFSVGLTGGFLCGIYGAGGWRGGEGIRKGVVEGCRRAGWWGDSLPVPPTHLYVSDGV